MPKDCARITIDRTYYPDQWERISLGLLPQEMEDKWFIYEDNYWVYFHRSWTGNCIYRIKFENDEDSLRITEAYANRDPKQYTITDDEYDSKLIVRIIDRFLLGEEDDPFPREPK